ncbi:hypothetical protein U14_00352 [Candidatus Moduliflexus flocculans]|uniref:Uncharacterized protein n=1 Tax=Candidatus Moduliflexus flocculans TaxID=1499966 RepID=A0A0S6VWM0_9BACT|nr:hypothetical protein U14_00352 [Candidatus Moduliflexus flocculans]
MKNLSLSTEQPIYDTLWQQTESDLERGNVCLDPYLRNRQQDRRRGWSLIIRPNHAAKEAIMGVIQDIQQLEPEQHYYHPDELHVTVLSFFSVIETFDEHLPKFARYQAALRTAFEQIERFQIDFRGITATRDGLMMQGFAEKNALNLLRDHLRAILTQHGLGDTLDTRYRIQTAHSTIVRFQAPLRNPPDFLTRLRYLRASASARTLCTSIQWVKNDWFLSRDTVELVEEFHLQ